MSRRAFFFGLLVAAVLVFSLYRAKYGARDTAAELMAVEAQIEAAQTMGASRSEIVKLVILPSARPALLDTLRITCGWAWTYLVVAELVAANSGLGYAILKAQRYMQTDKIFAGIILIGVIGLLTDQGFRWLGRVAFPWLKR